MSGFDEIQLINGGYYNFLDPDPAVLDIETIAHALSHMCRFSGHCSRFYSVAEHSWRASHLGPQSEALERLMHDAAESVVVDMPRPLKRMAGMAAYRAADATAEATIAKRFKLVYPWPASVGIADLVMLSTEKRDLMPNAGDSPAWDVVRDILPLQHVNLASHSGRSETWKMRFLARFEELAR